MKLPPGHVPGVGVVKATALGGLGERLLRKFGWTDGDGLGVGRRGRATPVETKQKSDNAGVSGEMKEGRGGRRGRRGVTARDAVPGGRRRGKKGQAALKRHTKPRDEGRGRTVGARFDGGQAGRIVSNPGGSHRPPDWRARTLVRLVRRVVGAHV